MPSDHQYMLMALKLAKRGRGHVEPNPMVGCLLVRQGQIIGQGYHQRFGGHHAEVHALLDARKRGHDPAGCDVYVTLEPCCHTGKTPPCSDALIQARVGRVFAAMVDPFPKVAGGGLSQLQQAGIPVHVGLCQDQAQLLNQPFFKRVQQGLPWVIAKWAQTLDGKIATGSGDSQWISNPASRKVVHQLRACVDAIVVGIGTLLADDPQLTARSAPLRRRARRVVVDPRLRIPMTSRIIRSLGEDAHAPPVLVVTSQSLLDQQPAQASALQSAGVELLGLPPGIPGIPETPGTPRIPGIPGIPAKTFDFGHGALDTSPPLDLRPLLAHLANVHQATNILLEGGCGLTSQFIRQKLVDQALVFVAPKVLGDDQATPALRIGQVMRMDQAQLWSLARVRRLGDDLALEYRLPAHP